MVYLFIYYSACILYFHNKAVHFSRASRDSQNSWIWATFANFIVFPRDRREFDNFFLTLIIVGAKPSAIRPYLLKLQ